MATIVVVGGGASGVASAYYLSKLASSVAVKKVILLEASSRLGGWIQSTRHSDGAIFERGPRSMRGAGAPGRNSLQLVEELGLENEVIAVPRGQPASSNRFIYVNEKLHMLPRGIGGVVRKIPPFSKSIMSQVWKEPFISPANGDDESIYDFVKRRLSKELAELAVDPFCRGVFAGDARQLSARSCLGILFEQEKKYGSITKAMLRAPKEKLSGEDCELVKKFRLQKWSLWSLRNGLQQLIETMETTATESPLVEIKTNTQVQDITFMNGKAQIVTETGTIEADHVISAIYAKTLSEMLGGEQLLSDSLSCIPAVTVPVVNLEYEGRVLPVEGFGHLVPSSEPSKVLGVLYESCVFKEHNNKEKETTKLTCMMGGAWYQQLFGEEGELVEDDFVTMAMAAIRDQLKITSTPIRVHCAIQKKCIPQYLVGHWRILSDIDTYVNERDLPLSLVGASYRGASVNDCIYNAKLNVERLLSTLNS